MGISFNGTSFSGLIAVVNSLVSEQNNSSSLSNCEAKVIALNTAIDNIRASLDNRAQVIQTKTDLVNSFTTAPTGKASHKYKMFKQELEL